MASAASTIRRFDDKYHHIQSYRGHDPGARPNDTAFCLCEPARMFWQAKPDARAHATVQVDSKSTSGTLV